MYQKYIKELKTPSQLESEVNNNHWEADAEGAKYYTQENISNEALNDMIEKIKKIITEKYDNDIFAAFLYGSYVTNSQKPHSDIDIMLISNRFEFEPTKKIYRIDTKDVSIYEINKEFAEQGIFNLSNDFINQFFCAPIYPLKNSKYIKELRKRAIINKLIQYKKYWNQGADKVIEYIYEDTILKYTTFGWQRYKEKIPLHIRYLKDEYEKLMTKMRNIGIGLSDRETNISYNRLKIYKNKLQKIYFGFRSSRGNSFNHLVKQAIKIEKINFYRYLKL
jgi:predicted nucleotidyltransferase